MHFSVVAHYANHVTIQGIIVNSAVAQSLLNRQDLSMHIWKICP